jgi:hypothetical protein
MKNPPSAMTVPTITVKRRINLVLMLIPTPCYLPVSPANPSILIEITSQVRLEVMPEISIRRF